MIKMSRFVEINAPVEQVFAYLAEPRNTPEYWPSFQEVRDIEELPNGGTRSKWVYKMAGVRFEGESEDIEFVPNQRFVVQSKGGIASTITWDFRPTENGGTMLTVTTEYTLPGQLLGRLAEPFIIKVNERESDTLMANIKARMEM